MKVRELIELNQMITDVEITVRVNGGALLDQLNIGPSEGIKPPNPTMVPKEERYIGNQSRCCQREAHYIDKSINAWDDGKDYWQVKPDRIPKKWLDLEVYSWGVWPASTVVHGKSRRNNYGNSFKNINFHGQRLNVTVLPSGQALTVPEHKPAPDEQIEGQMNIMDYMQEIEE